MTDHLEVGKPQPGVRYSTESEHAFDNAIWWGNLERAQSIISQLHDAVDEYLRIGVLPNNASRILNKELAMPMYIRAESDAGNITYRDAEYDISALYGEATALLDYYLDWLNALKGRLLDERGKDLQRHLVGAASEVTVFGLAARQSYGIDDDLFTILPADMFDDIGTIDPTTGEHSGFDFYLRHRPTEKEFLLQVKTKVAEREFRNKYTDNIRLVYLSRLAGGALQILPLQRAMVAEVNATATPEQIAHVDMATERFNKRVLFGLGQTALKPSA